MSVHNRALLDALSQDLTLDGLDSADMKGSLAGHGDHDDRARRGHPSARYAHVRGRYRRGRHPYLLKRGYTGDYAIVMEPTDSRIGPGTRGACWHRVTLTGGSFHCGLPHRRVQVATRTMPRPAG